MNSTRNRLTDRTIAVDNISARELVFENASGSRELYVLQSQSSDRFIAFEVPGHVNPATGVQWAHVSRTTDFYDDGDGEWFACYVADCMSPPFAIVRAGSFEQAYETFCDEFEDWIKVDADSAADYPEDERDYNNNGTHIDANSVVIVELSLLTIGVNLPLKRKDVKP